MKSYTALALGAVCAFALAACTPDASQEPPAPQQHAEAPQCPVSLLVLGVAQDAGKPQIGNPNDPAWGDPSLRRLATSLALIDQRGEQPIRWLFEATPDIKTQLQRMDEVAPVDSGLGLNGVFVTHAHIGHYAGLMMLGHEAAGAQNVTAYVMPRMADYLANNGPWDQLVEYFNIVLAIMNVGEEEQLAEGINVTPFLVPHRQEYSEVAGFLIRGPEKSALFIPDIDSWEEWDDEGTRIEDMIAKIDIAFLDGSFYANGEIPGRDMSGFPHPFVSHSMERFSSLAESEKRKVHFIHMNHTNPLHDPMARARQTVLDAGFNIAQEKQVVCL